MRPKACVIDLPFHKKTGSFNFIRDFLSQEYELHDHWDSAEHTGSHVPVEIINEFDTVFFFQTLNPINELIKINSNIVWFPMYDGVTLQRAFWLRLSTVPLKVICFSKKLYESICNYPISSLPAKYYLDPGKFPRVTDFRTKRVFFWLRGKIGLDIIPKIFGDCKIDSMDIRWAPDPKYRPEDPDPEFLKTYNVKITKGELTQPEYLSLVAKNNMFLAPRLKEGIGISFLESLAMGQCIIANNDSTMNEYIMNGHNGILIDAVKPGQIDLSHFDSMAEKSFEDCVKGHSQWQSNIGKILEFIRSPRPRPKEKTISFSLFILWILLSDAVHKRIRKLVNIFFNKNNE